MIPALGFIALQALVVAAAPTSPGECKPQASLAFAHQPNVTEGLSTRVIYNGLTRPRGIRLDSLSNLLVIDRGVGIVALSYRNDSTCVGWEKRTIVNNGDLNHGIEIGPSGGNSQYLYASSSDNVYRWEYDPSSVAVVGNPVTIAFNMSNADHTTRTLLLQPQPGNASVSQYIIVSRGSESNLDEEAASLASGRSQIRRFALNSTLPGNGWAWEQGELLGWGLRNAVGIALSDDGNDLWEVENSSDNVNWRGVDVHQDNPAEELNRISLRNVASTPDAQKFYGYPYCYTAWDSSAFASSTANPSFTFQTGEQFSIRNPGEQPDDAWCAADQNNVKPAMSFQAHSAPLDIVFYNAPSSNSEGYSTARQYAVNTDWDGDAFVSFHGSWNRQPATGYKVVRIPWSDATPSATAQSREGYTTIVGAPDLSRCPGSCIRPVGIVFDRLGRMFVSSDTTGEIFVVESSGSPDANSGQQSAGYANRVSAVGVLLGALAALVAGLL